MKQHGILIGRRGRDYLWFPGSEHVSLYARTRSGKTSSWVIPNCFTWKGSLVVLDVKGEVFNATAGHRKARGQRIIVLDPANPTQRTHRWNPLDAVDRESVDRFDQIRRQSYTLFPDAAASGTATSNTDKFWDPAGRSAFEGVATLIAETPELPFTLATVLRFFTSADANERLARMVRDRRQGGDRYSQVAIDQVSDYLKGANDPRGSQQVEGIRKTVTTRLAPWFSPRIQAATAVSDFDVRDIRREPMTIYVTVQPGNIARMRPYLALFFEQLINLNSDTLPEDDPSLQHQTLLMLDEFIRLGRLDTVAEAGQFLAGYGFRLALVVQDKEQLAAKYGKSAMKDIFANMGCEIAYATNDRDTSNELSERVGFNTVTAITQNRPRWWSSWKWSKQTESEHPHKRSLLLPQEIARLSADEQLVLRPGMMPLKAERVKWWQDPYLKRLRQPPPVVPRIEVDVARDDGEVDILPRTDRAVPERTVADKGGIPTT